MLSFSNFGDAPHPNSRKVAEAVKIAKARWPDLEIDGEMQADVALSAVVRTQRYPFTTLRGEANVLIFPNLESGNIAYKILGSIGGAEVIGPIVLGMRRAVNALQQKASVNTIVHSCSPATSGGPLVGRRVRRRPQPALELGRCESSGPGAAPSTEERRGTASALRCGWARRSPR